jgi:hypothetical protein
MSNQENGPVDDAFAVILRAYESLSEDERREVLWRLLEVPSVGCDIKSALSVARFKIHWLTKKYFRRSRKATPGNQARDEAIWQEKQKKSWNQLYIDHPGEERAKLRSAYRRAEALHRDTKTRH